MPTFIYKAKDASGKTRNQKLPRFLKKYFWDVDFKELDLENQPQYILGRILEYGDEKAVSWMKKKFTRDDIASVLSHFRFVSPKSANFWAVVFGIDKKKVLCLQKHYLERLRMHWPY